MTTPKAKFAGLALIAALVFGTTAPAWAGFDEGVAAHKRGDYATALREWRPLAEQGVADAQHNLGVMHAMGQGVPNDFRVLAACARPDYRDLIIVNKHKYFVAGGSYDWYWLINAEGREIGPLGPDRTRMLEECGMKQVAE